MNTSFKTAEFVSPKHPDKLCDRIADAILDAHLAADSNARTAIEVMGGHGRVYITGEITSQAVIDIAPIVERIAGPGLEIIENIAVQSPEIAAGVDAGGAGDQGVMIGYATSETPELLPLEVVLARDLNRYLYERWPYDGKTQITVCGEEIAAIVASFQHAPHGELEQAVKQWAKIQKFVSACFVKYRNSNPELHINPAGDWRLGGFDADAGLTGRKLIVDNYGPRIPIGGGAYSGKDPSKVDRSAAYAARYVAKNIVAAGLADRCEIQVSYAIGVAEPTSIMVETFGTEKVPSEQLTLLVREFFDLRPYGLIQMLDLLHPIYKETAAYGHFGREHFPWEKTDKAALLREAAGLK